MFQELGPYGLCGLLAGWICAYDVVRTAEDQVVHCIHPLTCPRAFYFIVGNGLAAIGLFCMTTLFNIPALSAFTLNISSENTWPRAFVAGLSYIVVIRSRLFPLRDNKTIGLDGLYSRLRDKAIGHLCTLSVARKTGIINQYSNSFVNDLNFSHDLATIIQERLNSENKTERIRKLIVQVENIVKLIGQMDSAATAVSHTGLIRTALDCIDPVLVERMLKNRQRNGRFDRRR